MSEIEYDGIAAAEFAIDHDTTVSRPNATVRLLPMPRIHRRWLKWRPDVNFHPQLRTPRIVDGLVVQWEAVAREGVAVVLSPEPAMVMGQSLEIVLGDQGNTRTSIRKVQRGESVSTSVLSRVCQERSWTSYWLCHNQGKVCVGVGALVGEQCVAMLDDSAKDRGDDNTNEPDAAAGANEPAKLRYVGFGNASIADRQAPAPLKVRNIRVAALDNDLQAKLGALSSDTLELVQLGIDEDEETKALMLEYQDECRKAKARAAKFGVEYKEPEPDAFLPWSQARKLRANPKQGFVTGLDLSSEAEKAKQEKRRQRFGAVGMETSTEEGGMDAEESEPASAPLPVVQAWDNEAMVRSQRADPPVSLWKNPPSDTNAEPKDEFAMEQDEPTLVGEKVHIFSIDWAAFKQIRTNDIMSYFSIYGPSYVEWLGDLSCNVLFEDKFSASRALENLSQAIPSPPPAEVTTTPDGDGEPQERPLLPDMGAMGWRFGTRLLRKVANDRYGRRGTTARLLLRPATSLDILNQRPSSWPKPPPGFTTKRVLGPGSDYRSDQKTGRNDKRRRSEKESPASRPWNPASGEEHPLLSGGLSAGRGGGGFSVEELEAERAKKRSKTADETAEDSQF